MSHAPLSIDVNRSCPLAVTYGKNDRGDPFVQVWLNLSALTKARTIEHLLSGLRLHHGERESAFSREAHTTLYAELPCSERQTSITLYHQTLIAWHETDGEIKQISADDMRLTVMELRMLGQFPHRARLPYGRDALHACSKNKTLITDLHTHLSSQVSAEGLLQAAATSGALYPAELLKRFAIPHDHCTLHRMASVPFAPAASDGLVCEQAGMQVDGVKVAEFITDTDAKSQLAQLMKISDDEVVTFDQLERRVYRLRNPLSKHPGTIAATILRVAEEYQAMGVRYAELAVTAALNPDWMAHALPALAEAEARTGVALRLLAAVPRATAPMRLLPQLEILKYVAQHPMVVGADFLGYEANKTRNFRWALSNIARWASLQARGISSNVEGWEFHDDFIIRVHAGENGKNPDNVLEVLDIAREYDVRVRVGHATYGDMESGMALARELAKKGKLIIEFNPDSNMAMNNIDHAGQLPIKYWADAEVPFVIASDGAGICATDSNQLLAASVFAGLEKVHLSQLHHTEDAHIARQQTIFIEKSAAFASRYANDAAFVARMREVRTRIVDADISERLHHKTPLLIAGASGTSWNRIDAADQAAIAEGITALVDQLDPAHVYFALGRVKHEGIGRLLDDALTARLHKQPNAPAFDVVGMLSGHQNMPTLADHINHIIPLHGELMSIPTQMTQHIKAHHGCALYIGGSAFTRDFIMCSEQMGLPFGVMAEVNGASGEKAQVLDERFCFTGAGGMVAHVQAMLGDAAFSAN